MIKVFYGSDSGYTSHRAEKELKKLLTPEEYREVIRFDGFKDLVSSVMEDCSSISLFGDRKTVLFSGCYFLSTATGKKPYTDAQQGNFRDFVSYLKFPNPDTILFMVVDGEMKKSGELYQEMTECPDLEFVSCQLPSDQEYEMLANKLASEEKKKIDKEATDALIERSKLIPGAGFNQKNVDYLTFLNSLNKLLTYSDHVTLEDVKTLVYRPLEDNSYEMVTALLRKDTRTAMRIYQDLRAQGVDSLSLLPLMASRFREIALIRYLAEQRESNDAIADMLSKAMGKKVSSGSIYHRRKETDGISFKTVLQILSDLSEMEKDIKLGQDNPDIRMQVFLSLFYENYLKLRR